MSLKPREAQQLRAALQEAVVKCSERCLYQSAKWYSRFNLGTPTTSETYLNLRAAELLNSIPETFNVTPSSEDDDEMSEEPLHRNFSHLPPQPITFTPSLDPTEALLEAQEASQYLLGKSFFDCREYARCAAVFLSDSSLYGP